MSIDYNGIRSCRCVERFLSQEQSPRAGMYSVPGAPVRGSARASRERSPRAGMYTNSASDPRQAEACVAGTKPPRRHVCHPRSAGLPGCNSLARRRNEAPAQACTVSDAEPMGPVAGTKPLRGHVFVIRTSVNGLCPASLSQERSPRAGAHIQPNIPTSVSIPGCRRNKAPAQAYIHRHHRQPVVSDLQVAGTKPTAQACIRDMGATWRRACMRRRRNKAPARA